MADVLARALAVMLVVSGVCLTAAAASGQEDSGESPAASNGAPGHTADTEADADSDDQPVETDTTPEPEADQEASASDDEDDLDERLDALLSEVSAADAYGKPINCLSNNRYRHIDIISDDLLLFRSGRNYWVNELKRSCIGLDRNMVIHTLVKGINSVCANDLVYANRRFDMDMGYTASGRPLVVRATCALGEFKPIDEAYAQSLRDMVR